jgi:hypothetical protein
MHSVEQVPNIARSLDIIAEYVVPNPASQPVRFVLDLAHRWKERGGTVSGKPRHSDRYLNELLRLHATPVKSLTPKLANRTHLRSADAETLVRIFLYHWDYVGDPNSREIGARSTDLYKPLLPDDQIEAIASYVKHRLSEANTESRRESGPATISSMPGQDAFDMVAKEFQESRAFFTVGAGRIVLVDQPEKALSGFRNLVDRLWKIDKDDDEERMLVWILDVGRQDFDDPESQVRFMHLQALISRFKALIRFKESATEARWDWLQSKSLIVLHDTRSARPDVPRLPAFDPHHVLFSAIPPKWAGSSEFFALYGKERLNETAYTIFLKAESNERDPSSELSSHRVTQYGLHFFGNALLGLDQKGQQVARWPRALKLDFPGRSYVDALGTVFVAATQMLNPGSPPADLSINGMQIDTGYAVEKLHHHGFLLLRLDEFIKF